MTPRPALALAALVLLTATPAWATGDIACRTAGPDPIALDLVVGHAALSAIVSARLTEGGRPVPAAIAQSWLDGEELRLDLADPAAMRHELRLKTRRIGDHYDGSVWRAGKRHWVRCREA